MVTEDDNLRRSSLTVSGPTNMGDDRFSGYVPTDISSPDNASWAHYSFIERGEDPNAMNMTIMDHSAHVRDGVSMVEEGSTQLSTESQGDMHGVDEVFHDTLPFPSSYHHEEPLDIQGKKIRFANIIATDMETTLWLPPHGYLDAPFASERSDSMNGVTSLDLLGQEPTLETSDHVVDQDEDGSSQMSEESEDEETMIRERFLYAVSGAGAVALLGWTWRKILQLVHRRVQEEEDDHVVGGNVWGDNPMSDHIQLKEVAKGMFANQGNKSSPSDSLNAATVQQ